MSKKMSQEEKISRYIEKFFPFEVDVETICYEVCTQLTCKGTFGGMGAYYAVNPGQPDPNLDACINYILEN
jgi:hypothetical protein